MLEEVKAQIEENSRRDTHTIDPDLLRQGLEEYVLTSPQIKEYYAFYERQEVTASSTYPRSKCVTFNKFKDLFLACLCKPVTNSYEEKVSFDDHRFAITRRDNAIEFLIHPPSGIGMGHRLPLDPEKYDSLRGYINDQSFYRV
jgi:hypothetical protein